MKKINLLKDGNGKYVKNIDFNRTWSVSHSLRFLSFAHVVVSNNFKTVLDIGFGDNQLVKYLEKLNFKGHYLGLDLNQKFVDAANKKKINNFHTKYRCANINKIKTKFDCIVCGEIIEHIPKNEVNSFLLKIKSLLNKNGKIIISTPNKQNNILVWPDDHIEEFSFSELKNHFIDVGLNIDISMGLWNNTENTKETLNSAQLKQYSFFSQLIPNSILNVFFNILNPEESRQIIILLSK